MEQTSNLKTEQTGDLQTEQTGDLVEMTGPGVALATGAVGHAGTPGDRIRSAVGEAGARGAPMISAQAMQAKLFAVYDDASVVPEALALVQRHLGLTLDRTWYGPDEVARLADELDRMLAAGVVEAVPAAAPAPACIGLAGASAVQD